MEGWFHWWQWYIAHRKNSVPTIVFRHHRIHIFKQCSDNKSPLFQHFSSIFFFSLCQPISQGRFPSWWPIRASLLSEKIWCNGILLFYIILAKVSKCSTLPWFHYGPLLKRCCSHTWTVARGIEISDWVYFCCTVTHEARSLHHMGWKEGKHGPPEALKGVPLYGGTHRKQKEERHLWHRCMSPQTKNRKTGKGSNMAEERGHIGAT